METSFSATYRTHPVHVFPWLEIQAGHNTLAEALYQLVSISPASQLIVIDGFVGLQWEIFISALQTALHRLTPHTRWLSTETCFRPAAEIRDLLALSLTSDPVFGRIFRGHLEELWDPDKLAALRTSIAHHMLMDRNVVTPLVGVRPPPSPSSNEGAGVRPDLLTIVYGFGASYVTSAGVQVYVDVPKDRGQQLAAQGFVCNVGAAEPEGFGAMYKRMYFVDWPMLNRLKRTALPHMDLFVDGTESTAPSFVSGVAFRHALRELAQQPFRVKPWFAPGPWGGQWMKEQFGLPPEQPNYAWSFELIAPENGVLLGDGKQMLECSFDYLLWAETEAVLGIAVAARYGSYFPIRFDYLDTMGGTNLSCQVHPRVDYIRDEFGEPFTQDETYYIVTNKPGARVFLGLHNDTDLAHFRADAIAARDDGVPFDIAKYVNSLPAAPHDLFLIPSGTVHCSGADNLVLEISATPYIYTFKIYDYLRKDLAGNLRHVHLDHAFANIDPARRTTWVKAHLCQQPHLLRRGPDWKEESIGETNLLFFAIHRLEFTNHMTDDTMGRFHVLNLIEGERCEIVTAKTEPIELRFAESMIIPASVGNYTLRNTGERPCKVVKAFVN